MQNQIQNALLADSQGSKVVVLEKIEYGVVGPTHNTVKPTVPAVSPEPFRPSILDMSRQNQGRTGSFRATQYDKSIKSKLSNIFQKKLHMQHHTDDAVLGDLLVCLLSRKQMVMLQSDFELMQGFSLFEQLLQADPKCHEALFGLGRINYICGRYELAEKLIMKAYESKRDFVYRVWLGYT